MIPCCSFIPAPCVAASRASVYASNTKAIIRRQSGAKFPQEMSVKQWKHSPMTDSKIAVSASATALAALLASAPKPPRLEEYRGALTPREFDASAGEIAAQARGAAAHDLGWMRRV